MISSALYRFFGMVQIYSGGFFTTFDLDQLFRAGSQARAPTVLDRLQAGPAVISLMQSSCSQSRFKVAGLDLVIDLAQRVRCFELVFSDLGEALDRIETAFAEACRDGD
jgi:hypothetical protein